MGSYNIIPGCDPISSHSVCQPPRPYSQLFNVEKIGEPGDKASVCGTTIVDLYA